MAITECKQLIDEARLLAHEQPLAPSFSAVQLATEASLAIVTQRLKERSALSLTQ